MTKTKNKLLEGIVKEIFLDDRVYFTDWLRNPELYGSNPYFSKSWIVSQKEYKTTLGLATIHFNISDIGTLSNIEPYFYIYFSKGLMHKRKQPYLAIGIGFGKRDKKYSSNLSGSEYVPSLQIMKGDSSYSVLRLKQKIPKSLENLKIANKLLCKLENDTFLNPRQYGNFVQMFLGNMIQSMRFKSSNNIRKSYWAHVFRKRWKEAVQYLTKDYVEYTIQKYSPILYKQ